MILTSRSCDHYDRFGIPIARDGGIADLLAEAARPDRRFDVVVCESIARVARRAYEGLSVERDLERCEVSLFAANETTSVSGSRAQRRINLSVAEYEVLNTSNNPGEAPAPTSARDGTSASPAMATRPRHSGIRTRRRPRRGLRRLTSNPTARGARL